MKIIDNIINLTPIMYRGHQVEYNSSINYCYEQFYKLMIMKFTYLKCKRCNTNYGKVVYYNKGEMCKYGWVDLETFNQVQELPSCEEVVMNSVLSA